MFQKMGLGIGLMIAGTAPTAFASHGNCVVQEKCIQSIECKDRGHLDSISLVYFDEANQRTRLVGTTYLITKERETLACPVWNAASGSSYTTVIRKVPAQLHAYSANLYVKGQFAETSDVPLADRLEVLRKSAELCEKARSSVLFAQEICPAE